MSKLEAIAKIRRSDVKMMKSTFKDEIHAILHFNFIFDKTLQKFGAPLNLYDSINSHFVNQEEHQLFSASEFKRASPSKGNIFSSTDPNAAAKQAMKYAVGGTNMISVLTEEKHFKGSLLDMMTVREELHKQNYRTKEKSILVLRKDFIVDEIQLFEARAYGADTVLLIVAILEKDLLSKLIIKARELGMEPLVEVATIQELHIALSVDARVIGVNNRNLHNFKVDLNTSLKIAKEALCKGKLNDLQSLSEHHSGIFILALSGIKTREDVELYENSGNIAGVLIGETLMRSKDPAQLLKNLIKPTDYKPSKTQSCKAKICGITDPKTAVFCAEKGVDFIGLIFAKKSKRIVEINTAKAVVDAIKAFRENESKVFDLNSVTNEELLSKVKRFRPLVVGVFQDQTVDEINRTVAETGIDIVQLHDTSVDAIKEQNICVPTIRVIHVNNNSEFKPTDLLHGSNFAFLLDTAVGNNSGGSGKTFDWSLVSTFINQYQKINKTSTKPMVFLAGGLNPSNISSALKEAKDIFAIDVSSGVEQPNKPGIKCEHKVEVLLHKVATMSESFL